MRDRLYKVLEDGPDRFRMAIHANDMELQKARSYVWRSLLAGTILFIPVFFAAASAVWGLIWSGLYIALIFRVKNYRPNGWSEKIKDLVVIDPNAITINGRRTSRSSSGNFGAMSNIYESFDEAYTAYGIQIRLGVTDTALTGTFPAHRLFERTEVLRLLNGALERIPPASTVPQPPPQQSVASPEVFL